MRTPKESFQMLGRGTDFQKIVGTDLFEVACDYALLELQSRMPPNTAPSLPTDPYVGLDANAQMWGARRVIEILKTLHEPIEQPKPLKRDKLNYANP